MKDLIERLNFISASARSKATDAAKQKFEEVIHEFEEFVVNKVVNDSASYFAIELNNYQLEVSPSFGCYDSKIVKFPCSYERSPEETPAFAPQYRDTLYGLFQDYFCLKSSDPLMVELVYSTGENGWKVQLPELAEF